MPKLSDDETNALYGKAEKVLGQNAKALKAQALLAWDERRSNDAMRVLSFVWGRNARNLARAVSRWPAYFMPVDGILPPDLEPDELQVLFMLAALPKGVAEELRTKWRQHSWRAWRVRQAVEDWRGEQKDSKLLRLRLMKARVKDIKGSDASKWTATIEWNSATRPMAAWVGKLAQVTITEVKEA